MFPMHDERPTPTMPRKAAVHPLEASTRFMESLAGDTPQRSGPGQIHVWRSDRSPIAEAS